MREHAAPRSACAGPVRLPALLAAPLSLIPDGIHSRLLALALNRVLTVPLRAGDLDFLEGRSVAIAVRDAGITFGLTLSGDRLAANENHFPHDLTVRGSVHDFLVLASQREDPDTLVFQRRLVMEGDTELGLELKNFLDALDSDAVALYRAAGAVLRRALPAYERLFGRLAPAQARE